MAKGRKTNKVAFSKMLDSYIKCVSFKSTSEWTYVLCDEHGNPTDGKVHKSNTYYSMFKWKGV